MGSFIHGVSLALAVCWIMPVTMFAEIPGAYRPKPVLNPDEEVGATGDKLQPVDTLPKSRAVDETNSTPQFKSTYRDHPALRANELVLNGGWKLAAAPRIQADGARLSRTGFETRDWWDATVPGTVLGTLVDRGVYPDPYWGLNNLKIPEGLSRQDYWYRTEFTLPKHWSGRELRLDFAGINYYAEIWLNGQYLGHITGAFIRGEFNVTPRINRDGTNVLAVKISPPPDPGIPSEQSVKFGPGDNGGRLCLDGPTFICSEGWDWIPAMRDRCAGIWQDVVLHASGPVTIGDPQVVTRLPLPDTSKAEVSISVGLQNTSSAIQKGVLRARFEGVELGQSVELKPGAAKDVSFLPKDFSRLAVQHPRLWWPNGYGKPELYHLQLSFETNDKIESDQKTLRFGIREMSYELEAKMPDGRLQRLEFTPGLNPKEQAPVIDVNRKNIGWDPHQYRITPVGIRPGMENSPALRPVADAQMGPYLVVKVNGRKIECLGGNWGMDDALKRISRERLEPYVRLHRDAHLNMIRNWCGQSTSEAFYDLCDEYGILVWNDFWMSTENANYAPADHDLFLENVADTIKRYRNHPCIALWCARNEGVPPEDINQGNARLVHELDGTRYYQPNSRLVNLRSSGPWANEPLAKYFTELNHGFNTELGASSIPAAEVMRSMMAGADLWPPGDVWAYHDLHSKGAMKRDELLELIARQYGEPKNLDDFCRKAQMLNYETYRAMYEGCNSRLWRDCSGVLVWMSHPSWPSVVWQFYSWDYDPNAAYFGAKKASEPVHIQMNPANCELDVINRQDAPLNDVVARARIFDLSGHEVTNQTFAVTVPADDATAIGRLVWPADGVHFVKLELLGQGGRLFSENFYWHALSDEGLRTLNDLAAVKLSGNLRVATKASERSAEIQLSNPGSVPALAIRLTLRNGQNGQRVLPAYYEDNYFSLLPGESRRIRIEGLPETVVPRVDVTGWNIVERVLSPGSQPSEAHAGR